MINTNTLIWIIIAWLMIIFFADIEIAFANANRLTIEIKKKQGLQRSILLSGFLNNPSRFISALLIGFNLFLVIFGLLVGETLSDALVQVDPDEFGRVMRNLLLNAIRHTPSEGSIAVSANSDGDGVVRITVSDACGGIPEEDLPRLFASAFRGSAARTAADGQGGGFGLAIARGIVEAHRGAIGVANHHPGCRFEVRLPVAAD